VAGGAGAGTAGAGATGAAAIGACGVAGKQLWRLKSELFETEAFARLLRHFTTIQLLGHAGCVRRFRPGEEMVGFVILVVWGFRFSGGSPLGGVRGAEQHPSSCVVVVIKISFQPREGE
jgi:hypothetical protein